MIQHPGKYPETRGGEAVVHEIHKNTAFGRDSWNNPSSWNLDGTPKDKRCTTAHLIVERAEA